MAKKFAVKLTAPAPGSKQKGKAAGSGKQAKQQPAPQQDPFHEAGSDEDYNSEDSLSSEELDVSQQGLGSGSDSQGEGEEDIDMESEDLGILDDEFGDAELDEGVSGSEDAGADGGSEEEEEEEEDRQEGSVGSGSSDGEGQGASGSEEVSEEEEEGRGKAVAAGSGKGASVARAMAKILQRPVKGGDGGKQPAQQARTGTAARGLTGDAAILSESATHHKRQAEEAAAAAAHRAAKKARQEARRRGRVAVPKRGQDPAHDVREKSLQKLATKGVVMLFNAVTKAQRAQQEAALVGSKNATKAAKASFLAQMQSGSTAAPLGGLASLGGAGKPGGGGVLGLLGKGKEGDAQAGQAAGGGVPGSGWAVLKEDFTGLTGSGKMKDWDRKQDDEDMGDAAQAAADSGDEDDGDDGW